MVTQNGMYRLHVHLPQEMVDRLDNALGASHMSKSELVRQLLQSWLNDREETSTMVEPAHGKYQPLTDFLHKQTVDRVTFTFAQIERLLGESLPRTARNTAAWWSNDTRGHTQARAWLDAGWERENRSLNLAEERVTFRRVNRSQLHASMQTA